MNAEDRLGKKNTNCFNIDLEKCIFLGEGRNGQVYLLPNGKALKIFFKQKNCKHEYEILQSANENKHFPKVYDYKENCIIREYVGGTPIKKYIETYGLSKNLIINIINLIEDFKKLGFTRLDIRSEHIFIQQDEFIKIIDPRANYTKVVPYPYSILSCLNRLGVLEAFFTTLKEINYELFINWNVKYLHDKDNNIRY